jgi:PEP-CTERM motif-containing protein
MTRSLCAAVATVAFLSVTQVAPAQAGAILFTDRTAFDQAVGGTTLLDFNNPTTCQQRPNDPGTCVASYGGLVQFWFDHAGFPAPPGDPMPPAIPFGLGGQTVGTTLLQPVTAMGFDLIPLGTGVRVQVGGQSYNLDKPQFFGFLFDSPFTGSLPVAGQPLFGGPPGFAAPFGETLSVFALDNLSLQTVPEPATLLTFGAAASFLLGFRRRGIKRS